MTIGDHPTLEAIRLHRIVMPMRMPFTAAHGTEHFKNATVIEVISEGISGWGECAALEYPTYTEEYADGAFAVLRDLLVPGALSGRDWQSETPRNPMAKTGLEMAILDRHLRQSNQSLIKYLETISGESALRKVPAGISIGIVHDVGRLRELVEQAVSDGYQRIRMKIERDWDYEPIEAIRSKFPDITLQVDANGSYRLDDLPALQRLEQFDLLMIEQPLPSTDLAGHAELARELSIPLCLDEPITSPDSARNALSLGACSVINIKVARLGGLAPTLETLAVCRSMGAGAWCGGMLDTGIGRAVNVALAALHGFTSPGDIAATDRYFDRDVITTKFEVNDGSINVPDTFGTGVTMDFDALADFTIRKLELTAS